MNPLYAALPSRHAPFTNESFKSRNAQGYNMRPLLLLLLLAVVASAYALPPLSPAFPSESFPTTDYSMTLIVPKLPGGHVNSTVSINYSHNAPTELQCALWLNSSGYRNVTMKGMRTETYTLANGSYRTSVECGNSSVSLSSGAEIFRVSNAQASEPASKVTLRYPLATAALKLNVTFKHNASSKADCEITMDDNELNTVLLNRNDWYTETWTFDEEEEGMRTFAVSCTNGTWTDTVTRQVNITQEESAIYGITVEPKSAFPGSNITFEAQFNPYKDVRIVVTNPIGNKETFDITVRSSGIMEFEYHIRVTSRTGGYRVTATAEDGQVENGTFTVMERKPGVWLAGNKTNVTAGNSFLVFGEQFLPDDRVRFTLTGGSGSIVNTTTADEDGAFAFLYPGTLAVRSYNLVARSDGDTTLVAYLSFNVTPKPVVVNNTPKVNNTPPPPPQDDDDFVSPPPVNNQPDDDLLPSPNPSPRPNPPNLEEPTDIDGGFNWMWIAIPVAMLVVIGGLGGFLVYNGTIDLSSMGLGTGSHASAPLSIRPSLIDPAEEQTIKSFIYGERGKGFDDLTIRGSLVGKGWDKNEVDRVFDEIYKEQ